MFPSQARPVTEETFPDANLIQAVAICISVLIPTIVQGISLPLIKPGLESRPRTIIIIRKLGFFVFMKARINVSLFFTLEAFFVLSASQSTAIPVGISTVAIGGEVIVPVIPEGEARLVFAPKTPPIVVWQLLIFTRVICIVGLFTIC
uniref:Uncharacterized protein n=1 Tax=Populus davidiana TaxID=266767 RepID=A0A6M2F8L2_9ROSI